MLAYSGRYYEFKQYIKAKPVKHGIKIWCLANSKSRYVWNIQIYLGKSLEKPEKATKGQMGVEVVLSLTDKLKDCGHVVVVDNFFTSPMLFDSLLKFGF